MKKTNVFLFFLLITIGYSTVVYGSLTKDSLSSPKQSILLEFAGLNGSIWSVNYERSFWHLGEYIDLCGRSGIGHVPGYQADTNKWIKGIWTVPIIVSAFIGHKRHYGILGCSYTASFSSNQIDSSSKPPTIYKSFESALLLRAGYRYCSRSGISVEVYPTWLLTKNKPNYFFTGFGASFGLALPVRIWK